MTYHSPKYWKEMAAIRRKHQADLSKDKPLKVHPIYQEQATEDTSNKPQAPSDKRQASSRKQQAPR